MYVYDMEIIYLTIQNRKNSSSISNFKNEERAMESLNTHTVRLKIDHVALIFCRGVYFYFVK